MKAVRILLIVVGLLLSGLLIAALVLPKGYEVSRSVEINAPKKLTHRYISHMKLMDKWSPWNELDPNQKKTFEGEDGKPGSVSRWEGNSDAGKGSQEIKAVSPEKVDYVVTFEKPFKSVSPVSLALAGDDMGPVTVTWAMKGEMPFPLNAMQLFMNMEKILGADFEKGLGYLKKQLEAKAADPEYNGYKVMLTELPGDLFVGKRVEISWAEMQGVFEKNHPLITRAITQAKGTAGHPSGIFYVWDTKNQRTDMMAAIPATGVTAVPGWESTRLSGPALKVEHFGAYSKVRPAYDALLECMADFGLEEGTLVVEQYVIGPQQEPDTSKWLTYIYNAVK